MNPFLSGESKVSSSSTVPLSSLAAFQSPLFLSKLRIGSNAQASSLPLSIPTAASGLPSLLHALSPFTADGTISASSGPVQAVSSPVQPVLPKSSQSWISDPKCPLKTSDFDCNVCFSLLCEPVTIPCGHTFCRACLVSCLERTKKKCPFCRAPCHIQAETQPSSTILVNMLEKLFPEEYKKRLSELATEKADWSRKIPLFLCGSPMFPGQPLSLHLFESRYRLMIQRVLQSNKRFGVIASEKLKPGDVGVVFEITECQFLPDGRALCESIGRSRFVLREFWIEDGTQGLHYATIDDLEDEKDIFEKPEFVPPQLPRPHTRDSDDTLPPMQRMDEDPDADDSLEFALAMSQQPLDSLFAKKKDSQDAYCQRVAYLTNIVRETMKEFMHFMPHLKTQLDKHYGPMPGGLEGTTSPTAPNFLSEASKLTFWIASILPLPAAMKLQMLGCKSLLARLDMSISALRSLLDDIRRKAAEPVPPSPQQSPAASQPHQTAQFAAEAQNPQYNVDYAPRGQSIPASIQYSAQPYEAITTLRQSGTGPTFL